MESSPLEEDVLLDLVVDWASCFSVSSQGCCKDIAYGNCMSRMMFLPDICFCPESLMLHRLPSITLYAYKFLKSDRVPKVFFNSNAEEGKNKEVALLN